MSDLEKLRTAKPKKFKALAKNILLKNVTKLDEIIEIAKSVDRSLFYFFVELKRTLAKNFAPDEQVIKRALRKTHPTFDYPIPPPRQVRSVKKRSYY